MSKQFQDLENIDGIRSVIAVERSDGSLLYHSNGMNRKDCAKAALRFWKVLEYAPDAPTHLTINASDGILLAYFISDRIILVHVQDKFDVVSLHSRLRDISAVQKLATAAKPPIPPPKTAVPVEKPPIPVSIPPPHRRERPPDRPVIKDDLDLLAEALIKIARPAKEELGIFVSARALRSTRDLLLRSCRCLYVFVPGKDCSVTIQDTPKCSISEASDAVAAWAISFLRRCNDVVPAFPPEFARSLLDPMRNRLNEIGFLEAWDEATERE